MYLKENAPPPLELKSVRPAGRPLFITGDPTCGIFLKRGLFRDTNYDVHMYQTRKYKNTNTQIRHLTKCQKDPTCGMYIFLKRLFKDIKNDIPTQIQKYKYTNTAYRKYAVTHICDTHIYGPPWFDKKYAISCWHCLNRHQWLNVEVTCSVTCLIHSAHMNHSEARVLVVCWFHFFCFMLL